MKKSKIAGIIFVFGGVAISIIGLFFMLLPWVSDLFSNSGPEQMILEAQMAEAGVSPGLVIIYFVVVGAIAASIGLMHIYAGWKSFHMNSPFGWYVASSLTVLWTLIAVLLLFQSESITGEILLYPVLAIVMFWSLWDERNEHGVNL